MQFQCVHYSLVAMVMTIHPSIISPLDSSPQDVSIFGYILQFPAYSNISQFIRIVADNAGELQTIKWEK